VADVFEAVFVASEIRVTIDKSFKKAGIRIPVSNWSREPKKPKP
jgi:small-conductance mechanosensitive channel